MAKKNANPDNLYTIRVDGTDYECIASLGASVTYKEEFIGKLDRPYTGILETDLAAIWRRTQKHINAALEVEIVDGNVVMDDDGNAVVRRDENGDPIVRLDADGAPVEVDNDYVGPCATIPNPDYFGPDLVAILRFVWAMARAAGSVREGWNRWSERVLAAPMSTNDQVRLFNHALYGVAMKHWFPVSEGRVGAEEQDEEEQA